jgi:hypothetical protein
MPNNLQKNSWIGEFSKIAYHESNTQKNRISNIKNIRVVETEIENTWPFTNTAKKIKYLSTNLTFAGLWMLKIAKY